MFFTRTVQPEEKIFLERKKLKKAVVSCQNQGKRVVFTNGCFDILHSGHVACLAQARALGDVLVVAVNTDESVKRYKGDDRPINNVYDRMYVLASLSSVDFVVPFHEDTPIQLIKLLKPDVYTKGGDYKIEELAEAPVVQAYGGRVEIMPFVDGRSTTNIISKVLEVYTHAYKMV